MSLKNIENTLTKGIDYEIVSPGNIIEHRDPVKEQRRFDATLQLFINKFTYDNRELALKESIEWADKILIALEKK